jgi:hypothetical protein
MVAIQAGCGLGGCGTMNPYRCHAALVTIDPFGWARTSLCCRQSLEPTAGSVSVGPGAALVDARWE